MKSIRDLQREREIRDLRVAGFTLQRIADIYGKSRERIRQILKRMDDESKQK